MIAAAVDESRAACARCRFFADAPSVLESEIAGLAVMSSAYASVCAGDGVCRVHHRYLSRTSHCADFAPAPPDG